VVQLLDLDAVVKTCDGDVEGACRNVRAALNIARSHGDEFTVIALLVRIAEGHIAAGMLERVLAQGIPAANTLQSLQEAFQGESDDLPRAILTAARGERALFHRMWQAQDEGKITVAQMFAQKQPASAWEGALAFLSVPIWRRAHAAFLRRTTELVEVARLPVLEQETACQEWEQRVRSMAASGDRTQSIAALLIPAYTKIVQAGHRQQAVLRCAAAALAAERYRQDRGAWPASLDALIPAYLKQVPADPYDGKPLRLLRTDGGLIVYSIGPDRTDDGGTLDRENPVAPGSDLGFQLWETDRRHRK
jgi:hypothetical protein